MRKAGEVEETASLDMAASEAKAAAAGTFDLGSPSRTTTQEAHAKATQVADDAKRQSRSGHLASFTYCHALHCAFTSVSLDMPSLQMLYKVFSFWYTLVAVQTLYPKEQLPAMQG